MLTASLSFYFPLYLPVFLSASLSFYLALYLLDFPAFFSVSLCHLACCFTYAGSDNFVIRYFYLPVMTALMWLRLKMYYELKYALFMLDFCYFVQPVTMMLLLVAPNCKVYPLVPVARASKNYY